MHDTMPDSLSEDGSPASGFTDETAGRIVGRVSVLIKCENRAEWQNLIGPNVTRLATRLARCAAVYVLEQRQNGLNTVKRAAPPAPVEISLWLTDTIEITRLNSEWRGKDAPANVLAFPAYTPHPPLFSLAPVLWGDVVLAAEAVEREARAFGKSPAERFAHLIIHGVLHLAGFTHDSERPREQMEQAEAELMHQAGYNHPYQQNAFSSTLKVSS